MTRATARRAALLAWHSRNRRDLPWRTSTDPYRVLVSEVMLQQTQAGRVAARYERFLARFPTVEALAAAPPEAVIDEWKGLGYYKRAIRLQRAARVVAAGGWPTTAAELAGLPGIGRYTAAAVASLAFGEQTPAVDTNLRRVLSRWHGRPLAGTALRSTARAELGDAPAGPWNEAMMDLGAVVCAARTPVCGACPVGQWCSGPDGYAPPRRQSPYPGSLREARARVVKALADGPATMYGLGGSTGLAGERLRQALQALIVDGMVVIEDGRHRLAG